MRRMEIIEFIKTALECSAYVAPLDFGLSRAELIEVAERVDFKRGEVLDSLTGAVETEYFGDDRLLPKKTGAWSNFHFRKEPDFRSIEAFEFVCADMKELARAEGVMNAKRDRQVLAERAVAAGISRQHAESALTILVHENHLVDDSGVIRFAPGREQYPLPKEQVRQSPDQSPIGRSLRSEQRLQIYQAVEDVITRRGDGRPSAAEPLTAFAEELAQLGYAPFRGWWRQTVSELKLTDPGLQPTTVAVLAAALVEGALTFVVRHARSTGLGVLGSKTFHDPSTRWKIDDLVASAAAGQKAAILNENARRRAEDLIRTRQRIHAGRMLVEYPQGVPDLDPEAARDAVATAELVVRCVLDWLNKHPVGAPVR